MKVVCRVCFLMMACTCQAELQNAAFEEFASDGTPVVGHVYSSAYREIIAGEPVTFFAPLHLPKDVGPVTATFEYGAASGGKGRLAGTVADGFASVKMNSKLLCLGIGEVTCTVGKKDGSTLRQRRRRCRSFVSDGKRE